MGGKGCPGEGDEGEDENGSEGAEELGNGGENKDGGDKDGEPGRGGISRGRGDARLRYGKESPELKNDLKAELLPKGAMANPEAYETVGLSATDPKANPASSNANAAQAGTETEGRIVIRRQWTAGQRETVRKYFKDEKP